MNAYIQILTYYKGLQSDQIAPLARLFGRGVELFGPFVILRSEPYVMGE